MKRDICGDLIIVILARIKPPLVLCCLYKANYKVTLCITKELSLLVLSHKTGGLMAINV
jgi:hypothetical protein